MLILLRKNHFPNSKIHFTPKMIHLTHDFTNLDNAHGIVASTQRQEEM